MRIVYKEPGKSPEIREVSNDLSTLQGLVGGLIEHLEVYEGLGMIINEEGKLNGLYPNFYSPLYKDVIVGPAVFVGEAEEDFTDIAEADAKTLLLLFEGDDYNEKLKKVLEQA